MAAASEPHVDIMNDPAFNNEPSRNFADGTSEPDHCRICRSEGTLTEPLFHPCKCNGSIKFVHQDCLKEWLQHSQKKYCELCKTPFRFTKLYDPAMPSSIPTPLFFKRIMSHIARNMILWARAGLVGFVWLGSLPWCVRWMWRFWFWVGDGEWWGLQTGNNRSINTTSISALSTSTASPPLATADTVAKGLDSIIAASLPSVIATLAIGGNSSDSAALDSHANVGSTNHQYGIFFDVNPFANLTRSPRLNGVIIDVLEGQLLTILITITFVLVFLLREWVVQQQPGLGDGIAGVILPPIDIRGDENPQPAIPVNPFQDEVVPAGQDVADEDMLNRAFGPINEGAEGQEEPDPMPIERPRIFARPRRRIVAPPGQADGNMPEETATTPFVHRSQIIEPSDEGQALGTGAIGAGQFLGMRPGERPAALQARRPQINREGMAQAAELRRQIEERAASSSSHSVITTHEFKFGAPTEAGFQFGTPVSPPHSDSLYTPGSSASSSSNNLLRDEPGSPGRDSERKDYRLFVTGLDLVDMGNPIMGRETFSRRSSGTTPASEAQEASGPWDTPGEAAAESTNQQEEDSPSSRNDMGTEWGSYKNFDSLFRENGKERMEEDRENGGKSKDKGKGKAVEILAEDFTENDNGKDMGTNSERYKNFHILFQENDKERMEEDEEEGQKSKDKGKGKVVDILEEDFTESDNEKPTTEIFTIEDILAKSDIMNEAVFPGGSSSHTATAQAQYPAPSTSPRWAGPQSIRPNNSELVQEQYFREAINRLHADNGNPQEGLQEILRQVRERQNQMAQVAEEAAIVGPPQANQALPHQPAPPRPRGAGLWDWIMGDQDGGENNNIQDNMDGDVTDSDDDDVDEDSDGEDDPMDPRLIAGPEENAMGGALAADDDAADDFDGLMELVGMRGPIVALAQNAAMCIVFITIAVAVGVAFPYVTGKIVMLVLAHPILFLVIIPISIISFCAEFLVDSASWLLFSFFLAIDKCIRFTTKPASFAVPWVARAFSSTKPTNFFTTWALDSRNRVYHKLGNLESTYTSLRSFPASGVPPVSLVTRQTWTKLTVGVAWALEKIGFKSVNGSYSFTPPQTLEIKGINFSSPISSINLGFSKLYTFVLKVQSDITRPSVHTGITQTSKVVKTVPVYEWSAWDRVAAVLLGYAFLTLLGALYLHNTRRRNRGVYGRNMEKFVVELLGQAGGVMKVVLIIGIEMFVFPLYCGVLLDVALLPLFEDATLLSRIQFSVDFPLTSVFVHWFVGTCYMFHFALFVSMCRKIMRPGVLYFIRDPDDPTFHPVKDVLERPVMMQLRKIGFSAFIYGVLVLLCLGGVVWSLYYTTDNVLPIHWSSNEPVLEFPVDLLFYNFFMPIAVKFFKPSDGLQKMYGWWFKKCARALRLTSFMFGEKKLDEEGHHVRRTWTTTLLRKKGDVHRPVIGENIAREVEMKGVEVYYKRDGRYVRAPASDSVRRPRGTTVFIPVTEDNVRIDGKPDPVDSPSGPNSEDFKMVYIPPWFRTRIGLVVLGIWLFAAGTGVAVTIGPLMLGRSVLKRLVPADVRLNDIYAFSVGVYILGGTLYAGAKWNIAKVWIAKSLKSSIRNRSFARGLGRWTIRVAKISYVFVACAIVLPTLFALMIEFYVIIPIHTYCLNDEQHVIHFIQDWTLGVLYVKMMVKMVLMDGDSRWARALRGVVARGYLDPDVKLATRCFIAPAGFMLVALLLPLALGFVTVKIFLHNASSAMISQTYRYSYPAVFVLFLLGVGAYCCKMVLDSWKQNVRDEVYLIGEQLHNHGEVKPPESTQTS
ncbi:hypothetical protein RUND412_004420 [Rhizina undulata]